MLLSTTGGYGTNRSSASVCSDGANAGNWARPTCCGESAAGTGAASVSDTTAIALHLDCAALSDIGEAVSPERDRKGIAADEAMPFPDTRCAG